MPLRTVTIYIDKKPVEAREGENLLKTCLGLGLDLPYFCWHPAMHSVGACRQCAVKRFKDENDAKGGIVMACMTPVEAGMYISIDDAEARRFRAGVIEWLMTNHPHDCPVCDEGGECHLQDMTVMTGHSYRRYRFTKRTHRSQDLGPFVTHEMNRCIACYRCTRFYNDYARGRDFGAFASHNHVFFGRAAQGVLESPFSGNLVEVCPTGVFDDKPFSRRYSRPWDLRTAPSVCVHCGLGCNTIPGERYGTLRRIRNRYNGLVNGYFLCDRGRYGYEFVNSDRRVDEPRLRMEKGAVLQPVQKEEALARLSQLLASSRGVIGIGSPRASLEANFALRTLVGPDRFYAGAPAWQHRLVRSAIAILKDGPALIATLQDVRLCDAVLVLGEDITNTAPLLHLQVLQSLRQRPIETARALKIPYWDDRAVRAATADQTGPLFVVATGATGLDAHATALRRAAPGDIARIGFAVAHEIDSASPPAAGLTEADQSLAAGIASSLMASERPLVVSGVKCASEPVLRAAANVARALAARGREARLCLVMPECNSLGLGLMADNALDDAFLEAKAGPDTAIILENDLYRRAAPRDVDEFLVALRHVVVIDHLSHPTALKADMVLPAATFAEEDGTLVNNEGRAQRYFQVFPARGQVRAAWRWLRDIMVSGGRPDAPRWESLDDITASMARTLPALAGVPLAAPPAGFRRAGMKIAREHARASGRTAINADRTVHEPPPPTDVDAPFTFSMEGYGGRPPSALIPRFWAPGWNSVQSVNKFQAEVGGPLVGGDPGKRLIEPAQGQEARYFEDVPEPFAPGEALLVVPSYHVFGSDELSMHSSGIAGRAPGAHLALSPDDMARLEVVEGEAIVLSINGQASRLAARKAPDLPAGVASVPCGVPGCPVVAFPAFGRVEKAGP
ncbi:MAG: NADH-quinone oxidoreductase subunit NuoG [Syntrophorhabdales bacterium]|jgi:NADH-quinone oxidoreductase subunit G